ncbi:MAG: GNAT family N-acetyltransferase [bacterium]|nr:GNAT family N-acetyltransferase [bacterium]
MTAQPTLITKRLVLRPFTASDSADVCRLAGDKDIASTTLHIPHPYEETHAQQWIATHAGAFERGFQAVFAVVQSADGSLSGAIGLTLDPKNRSAEMGYWIGRPFWGKGYCTEAARELVRYGFEDRNLNRIHANHFGRNTASGRVMEKIGMKYEGCLRQQVLKGGKFEDLRTYGILAGEFQSA